MVTGDLKFEGKQKGLSLKPDVLKNSKKKDSSLAHQN
jgi:hypothetical protein